MNFSLFRRFPAGGNASSPPTSTWRFRLAACLLLAASCIVPCIHYGFLNEAISLTRAPLTPLAYLVLRWFGQLSILLPFAVTIYWLFASCSGRLRSPEVVTFLAILLSFCLSFYAWCCAALLHFELHFHSR